MKRHKWNFPAHVKYNVMCVKCGMVKENITGYWTYFLDDTLRYKAGNCDERILKVKPN